MSDGSRAWRQPPRGVLRLAGTCLAAILAAAACGPAAAEPSTPSPSPSPSPTLPPPGPTSTPAPTPATGPPAGMAWVEVPEAQIRVPVPSGWQRVAAAGLADPAVRSNLAATYPGAGELLAALDELGDRAAPAFLAVNPSAASREGPVAANLTVLVAQPSVGGILLDFVAGLISGAIGDVLGATGEPAREHRVLPVGEAVRFEYEVPVATGGRVTAVAWVIGAPGGTLLVTVMGTPAGLGGVDPDAIAWGIVRTDTGE